MGSIKQEILLYNSGLNSEDNEKSLPLGDGDRYNIVNRGVGENGVLTNAYGNTEITTPDDILEYSAVTTYRKGDMVYYEDAPDYYSYQMIYDGISVGNAPSGTTSDTAYWKYIAYFEGAIPNSQAIASYKDDNTNSIYILRYSTLQAHSVFRYNLDDDSIDKIIYQEPELNFTSHPVRVKLIEFDGKLIWNEGYDLDDEGINPPRKLNIELAYNYTNYPLAYVGESISSGDKRRVDDTIYTASSSFTITTLPTGVKEDQTPSAGEIWTYYGDSYTDITDLEINLIKQPPVQQPDYIYLNDYDREGTNLRNVFWRFSYQYQYYDNEWSSLSPWSDFSVHSDDLESATGDTTDYAYNYMLIRFNTGSTRDVKKIRILGESSEVKGVWKIIKEVDLSSVVDTQGIKTKYDVGVTSSTRLATNTIYGFRFYNDSAYNVIDSNNVVRLFDNVPFYAGALELADNKILLGDVTTGYDNVSLDVEAEVFSTASAIRTQLNIGTDVLSQTTLPNDTLTVTMDITTGSFDDYIAKYGVVTLEFDGAVTVDGAGIGSIWYDSAYAETLFTAEVYKDTTDVIIQFRDQLEKYLNTYIDPLKASVTVDPFISGTSISFTLKAASGLFFSVSTVATTSSFVATYSAYIESSASTKSFNGSALKSGANHPFSFEYRDKFGRTNGSNAVDSINVYVPERVRFDDSGTPPGLYGFEVPYIKMTITHTPPSWAESCYLTYTGNLNYEKVIQFAVTDNQDIDLDGTGTSDYFIIHLPSSIDYQFQKGDFIRLNGVSPDAGLEDNYQFGFNEYDILRSASNEEILQVLNATTSQEISDLKYRVEGEGIVYNTSVSQATGEEMTFTGVDDDVLRDYARSIGEILTVFNRKRMIDSYVESQRQENIKEAQKELEQKYKSRLGAWLVFNKSVLDSTKVDQLDTVVEILRRKKSVNSGLYKEFIEIPLYESGGVKYHEGDQNQTSSLPAIINFSKGDVWLKAQDYGSATANPQYTNIFMERDVVTDFASSKIQQLGRTVIANTDLQRTRSQDVLFSNRLIQGTLINGLSTFPASNIINLNSELGKCRDIVRKDSLLYMIQDYKISTANIEQGVLGGLPLREQSYDYGSRYPVLRTEKYLYGFDIDKGVVWRLSYNGLFPISGKVSSSEYQYDYKMHKYFNDKAAELKDAGLDSINVKMGYDYSNQLIFITFLDYNTSANNETLAFSEATNRWVSYYDFKPELYSFKNNNFYTFYDGGMWKHDENATPCNFYGTQYKMALDVTCNINANLIKRFDAIHVHSNEGFDITDINIPENKSYGSMASKLDEEEFILEEGVYVSGYLRNMKTRTDTPSNFDLRNGEQLRGYSVKHTIEYDTTRSALDIELFKVDVYSDISKS